MYSGTTVQRTDIQAFVPNAWLDPIRHYRNRSFMMKNVMNSRSFVGQKGDYIHEPTFGRLAVYDKIGGQNVRLQSTRPGEWRCTIDKDKEVSVGIEKIAKVQSQYELMKPYTKEIGYALARDLDNAGLAVRAAVPAAQQIFVSSTGTAAGTPASINEDAFLAAKTLLEEEGIPTEEIVSLFGVGAYNDLLNITKFISRDFVDGKPVVNGVIGSLYGIPVWSSSNLTPNSNTGYRNGESGPLLPTPGVLGSPYMPTQDAVVGTGLPRGQTGSEDANPFITNIVCHRDWATIAVQKNIGIESDYEILMQSDVLVGTQCHGAKLRRSNHVVLLHTRP